MIKQLIFPAAYFPGLLLLLLSLNCGGQDTPAVILPATTSIVEVLRANDQLPVEQRIELYNRLKQDNPEGYDFWNENELTMYGYGLLWEDKTAEALEVFKLLVAHFPESANTYDSLGEAYLVMGDRQRSLSNYQKAFAMDPENFNAADQIRSILHPDETPLTDKEKFSKAYSPVEYREDLDQLAARLLEVHPNALKFISRGDFQVLVDTKKELVTDQTTYAEFRWHCAEIIAALNCSHTSLGSFSLESEILPVALRFPLQTRLVKDQLFVVDPLNNADKVAVKDEIVSINGTPAAEVIQEIYHRIPSQGYVETTKRHEFNSWGTGMISYALDFPESYFVTMKGRNTPITLQPAQVVRNHFDNPATKNCGNQLCFEILENGRTAVLTVASFNYYPWGNLSEFEGFIDSTFTELAAGEVENLIIDLRHNGGGSSEASIYLLSHLTDRPFTYFSRVESAGKQETEPSTVIQPSAQGYRGRLYFLIDGLGNSTTGHFMSLVKEWELGTIVGEELGSNQFCSAGQTVCRLSNTKVLYYVANNTHVTTATSLPDERGILPDHQVVQGIDDYLRQIDTVKEFALKLADE